MNDWRDEIQPAIESDEKGAFPIVPDEHEHGDYDRDVENVDDLEPDYDAEEVDEVDEEVEPVPFDELVDAATEEDQA